MHVGSYRFLRLPSSFCRAAAAQKRGAYASATQTQIWQLTRPQMWQLTRTHMWQLTRTHTLMVKKQPKLARSAKPTLHSHV